MESTSGCDRHSMGGSISRNDEMVCRTLLFDLLFVASILTASHIHIQQGSNFKEISILRRFLCAALVHPILLLALSNEPPQLPSNKHDDDIFSIGISIS